MIFPNQINELESRKFEGLTHITFTHNRISTYAINLMSTYQFDFLNLPITKSKFNVFGYEISIGDLRVCNNKRGCLLLQSHFPDLMDKGILDRRLNHSAVFDYEYEKNVKEKYEIIMDTTDLEDKLLMTAILSHYLQDVTSPMHTHPLFQEHHISLENYIDNDDIFNTIYNNSVVYIRLYGIPRYDTFNKIIYSLRSNKQVMANCGIKTAYSYVYHKSTFLKNISYCLYQSLIYTINLYINMLLSV